MQALPSAFFHQTSRASRMRVPRGWMAKSTMVVVPPKAAARVPVRKSSALVVPPKGMSRWVWQSMPPGRTYMPAASMTVASEGAGMPGRTSWMSSPEMRTSAAMVSVAVTTLPLRIKVFIGGLAGRDSIPRRDAGARRSGQRMAWGMRFDAETRRRGDRTRRTQERKSTPEKAETAETVALRLRQWVGLRREKDKAGRSMNQPRRRKALPHGRGSDRSRDREG